MASTPVTTDAVTQDFRDAMRRLAGSVTIVTVASGDERHGTTATAVTSLSMAPPSLIACFNRDSRLYGKLNVAETFCVNVLHADNAELARRFSSLLSGEERFAAGAWRNEPGGAPWLETAQTSIQCVKEQQIDYGSHTIFIGRVLKVRNRADIKPLIYCDGQYRTATPLAE